MGSNISAKAFLIVVACRASFNRLNGVFESLSADSTKPTAVIVQYQT